MDTTALADIVRAIIEHQESIMGPLAVERANNVDGVSADDSGIRIDSHVTDTKKILAQLVGSYQELFGQTSVEVCKDAVRTIHVHISDKDLPDILK